MTPHSFWLNGDAIFCACPDCTAPMSVRLWLLVADCWCCGTSIELSEEQEREIQRLVKEVAAATTNSSSAQPGLSSAASTMMPARPVAPPPPVPTAPGETTVLNRHVPSPPSPNRSAPPGNRSQRARPAISRAPVPRRRSLVRLSDALRDLPAWLLSLLMHLVVLVLLAILTFDSVEEIEHITLSTAVHKLPTYGGEAEVTHPFQEAIDLPVPENVDMNDLAKREAVVRADQDARELRLDGEAQNPNLPDMSKLKRQIGSGAKTPGFAARDPRVRVEMVRREGGTTLTEAAVARGLRWLAAHQADDGSWKLHAFNHSPGCTCTSPGMHCDAAGTSLALLPFLGAGQTHLVGRYQDSVSSGLRWLMQHQNARGDLRAGDNSNAGMYAHGQATIVLCEAYAMTGDAELGKSAQQAVDFIVASQNVRGGWRYQPQQPGDTSVLGWQLMALQSARAAKLQVPEATFELADHYLDSCQQMDGAMYSYQPGGQPTQVMTAEAILCRMYLGWTLDKPALERSANLLVKKFLPSSREPNIYYWYYGTQAMHHVGGEPWRQWNRQIRDILVETQEPTGHQAGSWAPRGPHADAGGRIYQTALSVCTLEVYYRHLPIFRQIQLE